MAERPGVAGALSALGGIAERRGVAGALSALGGVGGHFGAPHVMTRRQFEALVERALRGVPRKFKDKLANIAVVVEGWPDAETLADLEIEPPDTLYGLYRGVDLTHRDSSYGNVLPDTITIYQGPIEEDAYDEQDMIEMVRETVMHEVGHYFGLDDETMHRIEDE